MSRLPRDRAKGAAGGRLALAILVTALALPATAGEREPATSRGARAATGELLLFVRPEQGAGPPVVLRLAAIEAIDPDGTAVAVGEAPHEMRSDRGVGTGAALARGELPPGPYVALRLVLEPPEGAAAPPPIRVDVPFRVEAGRAVSVFLAWDPRRAPAAAFRADAEGPDVRSLLIFVTNRGGDEVTVIRRDIIVR